MNDKSHVSMEQHVCLVCGVTFDPDAILLDKRLRASMSAARRRAAVCAPKTSSWPTTVSSRWLNVTRSATDRQVAA